MIARYLFTKVNDMQHEVLFTETMMMKMTIMIDCQQSDQIAASISRPGVLQLDNRDRKVEINIVNAIVIC